MATFTNPENRNTATWKRVLKHGKEPQVGDIDFTFEDVALVDGKVMGDITFDELADQSWSNSQTRN